MKNIHKKIIDLNIINELKIYLDNCLKNNQSNKLPLETVIDSFNIQNNNHKFENWIATENTNSFEEDTFIIKEKNYDVYQKEIIFEIDTILNVVIFEKILFNKIDYEKNLHYIYYFYNDMFGFSVTCLKSKIFTGFSHEEETINTFIEAIEHHQDVSIKQSDYTVYPHNEAFTKLLRLHLFASNKSNIKIMESIFECIFNNKNLTQQYINEISILYDISIEDFFDNGFIFNFNS